MEELQSRKGELQIEFDQLKDRRTAIIEEGKTLQQEINTINNRLLEVRGAYAEVLRLLGEEPSEELSEEKPQEEAKEEETKKKKKE